MFKELDPVLHAQLRLAIISILANTPEAEFIFLKQKTNAASGNLSAQIKKLKNAGYIEVKKQFRNNYPQTLCKISSKGVEAFEEYKNALLSYTHPQGQF